MLRRQSIAMSCAALLLGVASAGCQRSDDDWNKVFHRSEGWWYSDGGSSAALPNGKTVWLFGDTWLRNERNLLFNSIALQDTELGRAPRADEIRFFARDPSGGLVDVTTTGKHAARSWAEPVAEGGHPAETWLWPSSALSSGGKLVAMYVEVGCAIGEFPACRGAMPNMAFAGHTVVEVDNPTDEPERWRVRTTPLRDRRGGAPATNHLHWGSALFEDGGWLYVFGTNLSPQWHPEDIKLARIMPRDVARYDLWQFLTPRGWQMLPTGPSAADLQTVARGGATELSVHRVVRGERAELVMVQTDVFVQELIVRTAPAGTMESTRWPGPEAGAGVRRVSLPALDPDTAGGMSWSGRAHPHHSSDGRLLVSYFSERVHSLRFAELPLRDYSDSR